MPGRARGCTILAAIAASAAAACSGQVEAAGSSAATSGGGAAVDPGDAIVLAGRTEAQMCDAYATTWADRARTPTSGSSLACLPGTLSDAGVEDFRSRVNFYRRWLGLAEVGAPDPAWSARAQACATMMGVAQRLSHEPGADWPCFTEDGAEAAKQSNLAFAGTGIGDAIDEFVFDYGNDANPGHRRWLLDPTFEGAGYGWFDAGPGGAYGFLTGACVVAFTAPRPRDRPRWGQPIAYPPAGAFPAAWTRIAGSTATLLWTISWDGASFAGATVAITDAATGAPIPLAPGGALTEYPHGSGLESAGFRPAPVPAIGDRWIVRVEGATFGGARAPAVTYEVRMVDCGAQPVRTL